VATAGTLEFEAIDELTAADEATDGATEEAEVREDESALETAMTVERAAEVVEVDEVAMALIC